MSYQPKVYKKAGGDELVAASGGTITCESGSVVDLTAATVKTQTVADKNVVGAIPVVHRIDVADAATGDIDVTLTHKTRITDITVVKTGNAGGAANTITVKNTADAISDAISINVNDKVVARAGTIDDAYHEITAGGTLRITRTKAGGNAACIVYVHGFRVE